MTINTGYSDRYDALSDQWTVLAPMPTPAADACAAYDGNGHMLVIGGVDQAGGTRLANVAQYDITAGTWSDTAVPDFPTAVSGARAVLGADGRVYVIGGETWDWYYPSLRDEIIAAQRADGSFPNEIGPGESFSTAVGAVILSLPYGYLPIFQR